MKSGAKNKLKSLIKANLVDREKYKKTIRLGTYIILFLVGLLMTILNIFTPGIGLIDILTLTSGIFSIIAFGSLIGSFFGKTAQTVVGIIFTTALMFMFVIFVIIGEPDGFSAIWICLLPICGMLFYGRKRGSLICAVMFLFLILFFWVKIYRYIPFLNEIQNIEGETRVAGYTDTFLIRFPILYISFFAVTFILVTIQEYQFDVLEEVNATNKRYSTHDQLTGLYNRKGFYDILDKEFEKKTHSSVGFIIFDLDLFKSLNDTYGHLAGDDVLREFSEVINTVFDKAFISCRWGGEEFIVCYFDNSITNDDIEHFRQTIETYKFVSEDNVLKTTVSGGVYETKDTDIRKRSMWLKSADEALYEAKQTGRNKIVYKK